MFFRPRIIPILSIDDRDLVKTVQFGKRTYLGDPVNAVKIFNRKGIDEMAILDISVSKLGKEPDFEILQDIASEAFMPLSYGGGITTINQIKKLFAIGYEKVILNSSFVQNPELIKEAVELVGSQSVVVSIDAKRTAEGGYSCVIKDGTERISQAPIELAKKAEQLGAGEIIINSVDEDGMMNGYDIQLIRNITKVVSVPVIACGGAAGISDLKDVLQNGGAHAAAGGSMFVYYGRLKAVLITAPSEKELIEASIYKI